MKIGLLCGRELSFPPAFIDRVNDLGRAEGITAEFVSLGGTPISEPARYRVIVDRISHEVAYYRGYLKHAVLQGTYVINNPFWWSADDKFYNTSLAQKLGVAVPKTVLLPQKFYPQDGDISSESLRNLELPIEWDALLNYVGRPATPEERLQDGGTPDIVQQRVPLNRVFQIAQGLGSDVHVLRVGLLWQQHRLRDGHAELLRRRSVEEFIVGRPPKRIVDDVGALQHGVLQIAAIVGHLMRDAVDNDSVARWFARGRRADTHTFSADAFRSAEIVDPADERRGKTVLPSA